jgi:hypothetical protein
VKNLIQKLEMGIKIETEHNDIYEFLLALETLPLTEKEFYEKIAKVTFKKYQIIILD